MVIFHSTYCLALSQLSEERTISDIILTFDPVIRIYESGNSCITVCFYTTVSLIPATNGYALINCYPRRCSYFVFLKLVFAFYALPRLSCFIVAENTGPLTEEHNLPPIHVRPLSVFLSFLIRKDLFVSCFVVVSLLIPVLSSLSIERNHTIYRERAKLFKQPCQWMFPFAKFTIKQYRLLAKLVLGDCDRSINLIL